MTYIYMTAYACDTHTKLGVSSTLFSCVVLMGVLLAIVLKNSQEWKQKRAFRDIIGLTYMRTHVNIVSKSACAYVNNDFLLW